MTTDRTQMCLTLVFMGMICTMQYNRELMNDNFENLKFIGAIFANSYFIAPLIYNHKYVLQEINVYTKHSSTIMLFTYTQVMCLVGFMIHNMLIANYITFSLNAHVKLRYLILPCLITGINLYLVIRAVFTLIRNFKKDTARL